MSTVCCLYFLQFSDDFYASCQHLTAYLFVNKYVNRSIQDTALGMQVKKWEEMTKLEATLYKPEEGKTMPVWPSQYAYVTLLLGLISCSKFILCAALANCI